MEKRTLTLSNAKEFVKEKKLTAKELKNLNFPGLYEIFLIRKKYYPESIKKHLHRFAIRFRLAKSFEGIRFKDEKLLGKTYFDGYDAGMKIFLVITAYMELYEALRLISKSDEENRPYRATIPLDDAEVIRNMTMLFEVIEDFEENTKNYESINKFLKGNNNVLELAYTIRSLFAHGLFTPAGIGLNRKNISSFSKIPLAVSDLCDDLFRKAIKSLENQCNL